jgi:SAM-dependent methyltransferase
MQRSDDNNVSLVTTTESVDTINSQFYGRFQFPWAPLTFDGPVDPHFETVMLNQSVGSWGHTFVPRRPKIWVAGCGTNQAVFTALRFPEATILATDLSATSIETSSNIARQLGVANVTYKRESINSTDYIDEFDYVICTGVIHHNANPPEPLQHLRRALKPTGILELMVYNRYHRVITTAFQKAIRILGAEADGVNFDSEIEITRRVIRSMKVQNAMSHSIDFFKDGPESQLADALLQPVEYSYTVESFETLTSGCGLEIVAPCTNQFDKVNSSPFWNMEFDDPELQERYDSFPDSERWQISNHLMLEQSPMLWFHLQRDDSGRPRKSEKQMCEEFLEQRFVRSSTKKRLFLLSEAGEYVPGQRQPLHPGLHMDATCNRVIQAVAAKPSATMREILRGLGLETKFSLVNKLRLTLTTNAFPYLIAADGDDA